MEEEEYPIEWPEDDRFVIGWDIRLTRHDDENAEFHDGKDQRNALRKARAALTNVSERYNGTPWAARARQELTNLRPLQVRLRIMKRHVESQPGPQL